MNLKNKFICFGVVLVAIVAVTELLNYENEIIAKKQEASVKIIQRHMDADMKHDGIRGNVYSAMVAMKTGDTKLLKDSVEEVANMSGEFAKDVEDNIVSEVPDDIKQQFLKIKQSVVDYTSFSQKISQQANFDAAVALLPEFNKVFGVLEEDQGKATEMILAWSTALHAASVNTTNYLRGAMIMLLLVAIGLPLFSVRSIFKPLTQMIGAMQRLSEGELSLQVPYLAKRDEIGQMAQALQVFKENALRIKELNDNQENQKREAEREKRAAMRNLADGFEASVRGIVSTVASAATELSQTASEMVGIMTRTSQDAQKASSTSTQTTANVQSVASAAEELTASVREISSQLNNSNILVNESVNKTAAADVQAAELSAATNKVKEVIGLISSIAGQINLLALNATIESARAGEAGKGFAVVASEVKNLAGQTDKSVQEIDRVIQEMDEAAGGIIGSLKSIKDSIGNISSASSTIAAAVEEQSATTNEIARNMQSAAQGTQAIADNLRGVSGATSNAQAAATQVMGASQELSKQAEKLSMEVEKFLNTVRNA